MRLYSNHDRKAAITEPLLLFSLKPGFPATEETKQSILAHCRKNIAKYAMPYDIEFRENLPTTLVGKVAYRVLEDEELKKIS